MSHEVTPVDSTPEGKVTIVCFPASMQSPARGSRRRLRSQLPGAAADLSAATFCIMEEDHTLGNILRWMIMKKCVSYLALLVSLDADQPRAPARPSSFAATGAPSTGRWGQTATMKLSAGRPLDSAPHPSEAKIHIRIQMYGASPVHPLRLPRRRLLTLALSHSCVPSLPHSSAHRRPPLAPPDGKSSRDALNEALDNLEHLTLAVLAAYEASLAAGDYETVEDLDYSFEAVNDRLWAEKEAAGRGSRAEFEQKKQEERDEEEREKEKLGKPKKGKPIKVGK